MKRFEMIFLVLGMWAGAELGGNIGLFAGVAIYIILAEIGQFSFRKLMKKLNYVRKEG